jgi:archaellin
MSEETVDAKREFRYTFIVSCASEGTAELDKVEQLIDLSMQELVYDDAFIAALDEGQAVTIQVVPNFG